jgi:hypothetical protein
VTVPDTVDLYSERCDGCGLETPGGSAGCQAIFEELLARDFSDPRYFRVHRMLVDTYSLQHPDRYCKSAKSLAAHLCGLCQILEARASRSVGDAALRRWLDGTFSLSTPEVPAVRGDLTIASVRDAATPADHAAAVERWAASTWRAYAPLHDIARNWLERAGATR